jgi:hypothetical protein
MTGNASTELDRVVGNSEAVFEVPREFVGLYRPRRVASARPLDPGPEPSFPHGRHRAEAALYLVSCSHAARVKHPQDVRLLNRNKRPTSTCGCCARANGRPLPSGTHERRLAVVVASHQKVHLREWADTRLRVSSDSGDARQRVPMKPTLLSVERLHPVPASSVLPVGYQSHAGVRQLWRPCDGVAGRHQNTPRSFFGLPRRSPFARRVTRLGSFGARARFHRVQSARTRVWIGDPDVRRGSTRPHHRR